MMKVTLHRDDLQKILELVDKLNPADTNRLCAGFVTINVDSSSGIGSIIEAEVQVEVDGEYGVFRKSIVDESSW
jgi:hypothetical protein